MSNPEEEFPQIDPPDTESKPKIRKVSMISPGFRQTEERSVLRPRVLGFKLPADPNDIRNFKMGLVAVAVSVVIFIGLEYKQVYEAAREGKHQLHAVAHDTKHSILEFFKK
jgi:hypothetical protein